MSKKVASAKRSMRVTTVPALKPALLRRLDNRILGQGQIDFPALPALIDVYMQRLTSLWEALGKPFSDNELAELRALFEPKLKAGYQSSANARVSVAYEARPLPQGIRYTISVNPLTMADVYAEWVANKPAPLFGKVADAKVLALAARADERSQLAVLDIGAGTGRNSLALARLGHPVTAVEPVSTLAAQLRELAATEQVSVEVIEADVLSEAFELTPNRYQLVVLSEVVSHFRGLPELVVLFEKLSAALAPGSLVVMNSFLAMDGYRPDPMALQASEVAWAKIFTRAELAFIVDDLPFDRLSDESAPEYEQAHVPAEHWPPTPWYVDWANGGDVFALPRGKGPIELRWLVFRRR